MVTLIPVRAGSERIPGKAMKLLGGHPLLAYTMATATQLRGQGKHLAPIVLVSNDDAANAYVTAHWPEARAQAAINGYLEGTPEGSAEFERADQEMRAVRTDGSIPREARTTKDALLGESLDGMALIRASLAKTGGRA